MGAPRGSYATEPAGSCFRRWRDRALPYDFSSRENCTAFYNAMKTRTFQSALAMVGEACLIGDAAETFSQFQKPSERDAMNEKSGKARGQMLTGPRVAHTPVLPTLREEIHRIVSAACAAKGGLDRMTLKDWREAEQEIRRRLHL